jgi:hypothetical protein
VRPTRKLRATEAEPKKSTAARSERIEKLNYHIRNRLRLLIRFTPAAAPPAGFNSLNPSGIGRLMALILFL